MPALYRHDKRPAWGEGALIADEGDRLRILFADGTERRIAKGAAGLVEIGSSPDAKTPGGARQLRTARPSTLIKAVRLAVRDALTIAKSNAGYPDDTLIEMQKCLSRVTADHARFLNTRPEIVRKVSADAARPLVAELGASVVFEELATRLSEVDRYDWPYTRAFADPLAAADHVRALIPYVRGAMELTDAQLDELEALLSLDDRGER